MLTRRSVSSMTFKNRGGVNCCNVINIYDYFKAFEKSCL
jgi:hypothetical protein